MSARRSHAATLQLWSERIKRFESSTATIAQFCATEGCSQASFYQWRRKLRSEAPQPQPSTAFVPVKLAAPVGPEQPRPQTELQDHRHGPRQAPTTVMSVEMPGGIRVRIEVAEDQGIS